MECLDDYGVTSIIVGVQRPESLHMISAMQLKQCMHKGCQLYAITISDKEEEVDKETSLDDHPIL